MAEKLKRAEERRLVDMLGEFLRLDQEIPSEAVGNTEAWRTLLRSLADRLLTKHGRVESIASELDVGKNKRLAAQVRGILVLIDDTTTAAVTAAQIIARQNTEIGILRKKIGELEAINKPAKGKSKKR